MPYKVVGNKVMHKKGGKWKVKQTAGSHEKAESTMRLLHGIEHGWKPTGKNPTDYLSDQTADRLKSESGYQ